MDQRLLERYIDVVESGSLSRTARRMNVSQPALSKSLSLLESQYGVKLLERGPKGVRATRYGEAFYRRAQAINAEFKRAEEELKEMRGTLSGHVALGATPGPGVLDRIFPTAIQRVSLKWPTVGFSVRSGNTQELVTALHLGELDILVSVLDDEVRGPDVHVIELFEDQFSLVVNVKHPLLRNPTITISDLASYGWAFMQDGYPLWRAVETKAQEIGRTMMPPVESNSVVFTRSIIANSDRVGILPSHAAEAGLSSGTTAFIPLDRIEGIPLLPRSVRPLGIIYSKQNDLSRACETVIRTIKTVCFELKLLDSWE